MKTAAKTFIIIGMVLGCLWIVPIVVGAFALNKIANARCQEDLKTMGILTIIFCSLLGGIFMLCIKDEELMPSYYTSSEGTTILHNGKHTLNFERSASAITELEKLKALYDKGILTKSEYEKRKLRLLEEV